MNIYLAVFMLIMTFFEVKPMHIERRVMRYFASDVVKSFRSEWKLHKRALETALEMMLRQNYGSKGMNIYVRKTKDAHIVAKGLFVSDNIVDVLFENLYLMELPLLRMPEIRFALASNHLKIEATLGKIIVEAKYHLFRNHSAIVYSNVDQDLKKISPFSLQQVQKSGELTIIADDCTLEGFVIATLKGQSVDLGDNSININDCKFSLEIWTPGLGMPPVIAPYFSIDQADQLQRLISKPIRDELLTKLQGAMFSYVNTSAIFGHRVSKFRKHQRKIFVQTTAYMRELVNNLNKLTVNENNGVKQLSELKTGWTEMLRGKPVNSEIIIKNVTIQGLDSAYSAHNGGPFKSNDKMKIEENIKYNVLQVRGIVYVDMPTVSGTFEFGAEVLDVTVHMTLTINLVQLGRKSQGKLLPSKEAHKCEFTGWRDLELNHYGLRSVATRTLIIAYLTNEIPTSLEFHNSKIFLEAVKRTDQSFKSDALDKSSQENNDKDADVSTGKNSHETQKSLNNIVIHDNNNKDPGEGQSDSEKDLSAEKEQIMSEEVPDDDPQEENVQSYDMNINTNSNAPNAIVNDKNESQFNNHQTLPGGPLSDNEIHSD